jgi:hypothetical protein
MSEELIVRGLATSPPTSNRPSRPPWRKRSSDMARTSSAHNSRRRAELD